MLFGKLEGQLGLQPPPCAKKLKRGGYSANVSSRPAHASAHTLPSTAERQPSTAASCGSACVASIRAPRWPALQKEVMQALVRLNPDCPPVVKLIAEHRRLAYSVWFIRQLLQCARAGAALAQQLEPAAGAAPLGRAGGGPRIWTVLHQTNSDTGAGAVLLGLLRRCVGSTSSLCMGLPHGSTHCNLFLALAHGRLREGTAGRLAMDDPSLQCVPRTHELRMLLKGTAREGDDVSASGQHR